MRDYRDDEDLLDEVDRVLSGKSAPSSKDDDGINWDDYNFNFDNEIGQPEPGWQQPQTGRRVSRGGQEGYSVDYMRRLHQNGGQATYRDGVSPAYPEDRPSEWQNRQRGADQPEEGRASRQSRQKRRKRRRKGGFGRFLVRLLLVLVGLLVVFALAMVLMAKMPQTDQPIGERKDGCATILLAGTDEGGARTDTMMLLYIDRPNKQMRLLSLPRDTMVNRDNSVPKLNGAYYANGGDEVGMDYLMGYVADLVGYRPDGYMLIDLNCFIDLVDLFGGVTFDVPMDMYYDDPTQDLHIDLKAGEQKLNGQEAMWLVRFRSGYAMADLERVNVQREFLSAAMSQWTKVWNIYKAPAAIHLVMKNTLTDLSARNLSWVVLSVAICGTDDMESNTLPGSPKNVNGGSYYVEDRELAAQLVNEKYNPYTVHVTASDLHPYGY